MEQEVEGRRGELGERTGRGQPRAAAHAVPRRKQSNRPRSTALGLAPPGPSSPPPPHTQTPPPPHPTPPPHPHPHLQRRMSERSSQRVASKSSSSSILWLTTRPMSTAAASWSKPWMRSPRLLPSTQLQQGWGGGGGGAGRAAGGGGSRAARESAAQLRRRGAWGRAGGAGTQTWGDTRAGEQASLFLSRCSLRSPTQPTAPTAV